MRSFHDIKFGMLQVREDEISLHKWSGGTAQLRNSEGAVDAYLGKRGFLRAAFLDIRPNRCGLHP